MKKIFGGLFKWIGEEVQQGINEDLAKKLETRIETFERNRGTNWTIAHDEDIRTLKKAVVILRNNSK